MLVLEIPASELYDDRLGEFFYTKAATLRLEHSLISLSKWESKWKRPFLGQGNGPSTRQEWIEYIRCMTINRVDDPNVYLVISDSQIQAVTNYIRDDHTATVIRQLVKPKRSSSYITSEVIYYLMFSYGIDKSCEKWHLGRLLTLIEVFDVKNQPHKKRSAKDTMLEYDRLNEQRKAALHSKG